MRGRTTFTIGTRGSALALIQARTVRDILSAAHPDIAFALEIIRTEGDRKQDVPLTAFDGRGAFVAAIERALLDGQIDLGVHSLKDLPSQLPEGLALGASPVRIDPRDALVTVTGARLGELPAGAVVGTGSERRSTQIAALRPDLTFRLIRGNIETRIGKLSGGDFDAVVIAAAALERLGLTARAAEIFDADTVIPAPCQGAIGVERRGDDDAVAALLGAIDDPGVRCCVDAERAFIATLGFGCHAPIGAYARPSGGNIELTAFLGMAGRLLRDTVAAPADEIEAASIRLAQGFRAAIEQSGAAS